MPSRFFSLSCFALWALLASPAGATETPPPAAEFDPDRISWQKLSYKASKLLLTARSQIEIAPVSAEATRAALIGPETTAATLPDEELRILSLRSQLLGRDSVLRLWFAPDDAGAIQRIQVETGSRNRYKGYRFLKDGVWSLRRTPERGEDGLSPEQWSDVDESFDAYPATGGVVTEASALFYVLSASRLAAPGDVLEILVYSNNELMTVQIRAAETIELKVDYEQIGLAERRRVRGRATALRLEVSGKPLAGEHDGEGFEFLGLHGDIEVYLDPVSRVPLQVSGRLPVVGAINVRLQSVELDGASEVQSAARTAAQ